MERQRHNDALREAVERLSDEGSYAQLFHAYCEEEELPSGKVLQSLVELCRAILFPGYYGQARITGQTIRFHTGVSIEQLFEGLSKQIYAGLCLANTSQTTSSQAAKATAERIAEEFISSLPELRSLLATDAEAMFDSDPAAQNPGEVIFCYPGFRAICNYRIAHVLYRLEVPFIPRMITEMAHSETGIDIHPGATIGHHFSIDHGPGIGIGALRVTGD